MDNIDNIKPKEKEPKEKEPKECLSWMNQITLDLLSRHKIHKIPRIQTNEYNPYHIRLHQLFDTLLQGQGQEQKNVSQKVTDAFHVFVKQCISEFQKEDNSTDTDTDNDEEKEDDDVLEDEEDEDKWR